MAVAFREAAFTLTLILAHLVFSHTNSRWVSQGKWLEPTTQHKQATQVAHFQYIALFEPNKKKYGEQNMGHLPTPNPQESELTSTLLDLI